MLPKYVQVAKQAQVMMPQSEEYKDSWAALPESPSAMEELFLASFTASTQARTS